MRRPHFPECLAVVPSSHGICRADPGAFPLSEPVGVVIVSGGPFDEPEGYTVATAIEEVLVDAGFLADERQVEWEGHDIQPDMATGYSIRVEPATA